MVVVRRRGCLSSLITRSETCLRKNRSPYMAHTHFDFPDYRRNFSLCTAAPFPILFEGRWRLYRGYGNLRFIKEEFQNSGYFKINSRHTPESETVKNHEVARFIFFLYTCYTPTFVENIARVQPTGGPNGFVP